MLGVSIQDDVFQGKLTKKSMNDLIANCDSIDQYLYHLKSYGVNSIEVRILPREADETLYVKVIQQIWDAGLRLTVHGHVKGEMSAAKFEDIYPSMKYILRNYEKYQDELVMAIHAFDAKAGSEEELFNRTVELFRQWTTMAHQEHLPLRFALENNRKKPTKVDPGDTTESVLRMVELIDSPHMGITWDMGHYYSDLLSHYGHRNLSELPLLELPNPAFLKRVIHTHIHGIGDNNDTHHPLTEMASLPLEYYVNALRNNGYQGAYNLELTLYKFGQDRSILEHVGASVQRLKDTASTTGSLV
ncbi:MAG: sugar phosphate isomerase/epimerase family protein [Candidatus Pristimantibacillus sp.]